MKTKIALSIPLGGIISFVMFVYLIYGGIWYPMNIWLKVLMIFAFIFLTLVGWIEYERTVEK